MTAAEKTPVKFACDSCGCDGRGRRFQEDTPKRSRRFYIMGSGQVCGSCLKKFGKRAGK